MILKKFSSQLMVQEYGMVHLLLNNFLYPAKEYNSISLRRTLQLQKKKREHGPAFLEFIKHPN